MNKITLTLGIALLSIAGSMAQTEEERAQIISNYNLERLEDLRNELQAQNNARMARAQQLAEINGWPLKKSLDNGGTAMLYDVIENKPVYRTTENRVAGLMQGANELWNGGALGINVEGQGMEVGIWDGGLVLETHEALVGRIVRGQTLNGSDSHGTHVGGTIIADGVAQPNAKGMAPQATLKSFDFSNDTPEVVFESGRGMLVSNHSYGVPAGNVPISQLGKYTIQSVNWDNITYNAPYYLPVFSAGNDRNAGVNTSEAGYDLLVFDKVSKNVLTVGATVGNPNYSGPGSVPMSNFSSWGPADDGRVKPDISTKGVAMYSTTNSSASAYAFQQGTSMSAPAVTGGLALLQQYYNQLNAVYMRSSTLKGLVLHTAKEAGANDGPDYQFGWGLLDTEAAALALQNNGTSSLVEERNLVENATYSQTFSVSSGNNLIISISWTDPSGAPNNGPEDDATPALINNLDLVVTDGAGNTFHPWKLNPAQVNAAATNNSDNDVDVFEKIEIPNASGTYTLTVSHKGTLRFGSQDYALIITGADNTTFSNESVDVLDKLSVYPNPARDHFTVAFNNQLSGDSINVQVYDVLGKLVMNRQFDNNGVFEQRIDATSLDSGIYLVKVGNGVTSSTKKLIIR